MQQNLNPNFIWPNYWFARPVEICLDISTPVALGSDKLRLQCAAKFGRGRLCQLLPPALLTTRDGHRTCCVYPTNVFCNYSWTLWHTLTFVQNNNKYCIVTGMYRGHEFNLICRIVSEFQFDLVNVMQSFISLPFYFPWKSVFKIWSRQGSCKSFLSLMLDFYFIILYFVG